MPGAFQQQTHILQVSAGFRQGLRGVLKACVVGVQGFYQALCCGLRHGSVAVYMDLPVSINSRTNFISCSTLTQPCICMLVCPSMCGATRVKVCWQLDRYSCPVQSRRRACL